MRISLILCIATLFAAPAVAQETPKALVDYAGFERLTGEVFGYRQNRMVNLQDFRARAAKPDTMILDTRSAAAFAAGHIEGAVNLPFSEFTEDSLRAVIGEANDREILIYCNNNFTDNIAPVRSKRARLALNIPTFINLYGYGYRNIYELEGAYQMKDPSISWISQ
ncbi:MAG: rhodanese-like domain-containing protein [Parasphingorhabdus sp.]|uniref:rhodanese-like domain-containing protein n=1 Tax=Parasphingorhabdus sp. TaxID=2709688 RepID=UPI0032672A13